MKIIRPKKPTKLQIWSAVSTGESLESFKKFCTAEIVEYIDKVVQGFKDDYQKCFDVSLLIYSKAMKIKSEEEREKFLDGYIVKDIVELLMSPVEGKEYQDLIWLKLRPGKKKK